MNLRAWLLLAISLPVAGQTNAPLSSTRVLWLGDSITQGGDYVSVVEYYLDRLYPKARFDFVSIGLSSETVSCLTETDHPFPRPCLRTRLAAALEKVHPQTVVAMYGMNDGIYHPWSQEREAAFRKGVADLIAATRAEGSSLILLTPTPFDPVPVKTTRGSDAPDFSYKAPFQQYDEVLARYAAWEKSLTAPDVRVIDLHSAVAAYIDRQRAVDPKFSFTGDGIHPDFSGHVLMAREIVQALGGRLEPQELPTEAARLVKDSLFVLVKSRREQRSKAWLDYVGYTRDKTVQGNDPGSVETIVAELQQQIDAIRTGK